MSRRKETTTITVSEENYRKLLDLKAKKRHDSSGDKKRVNFDGIISMLLEYYSKKKDEEDERRETKTG